MAGEELNRIVESLGEIKGSLSSLIKTVDSYVEAHDERHKIIDTHIDNIKTDINQAKGARGAVVCIAGFVSALIGTAIAAASKWIR